MAAVVRARAEVLDDQQDVVVGAEGVEPRADEQVGPLAPDRAADEQEHAAGGALEVAGGAGGRELVDVHTVGYDLHDAGRHPTGNVARAHILARNPDAVDASARRDPFHRRSAELPRQGDDSRPVGDGREAGWPRVREPDGRLATRGRHRPPMADALAARLERVAGTVVDDRERSVAAERAAQDERPGPMRSVT